MKQNIIKFKSLAFGICATCMVLVTGCSESEYAKINTDPSTIAEGNPVFFVYSGIRCSTNLRLPAVVLRWGLHAKNSSGISPSSSFNDLYNKLAELGGVGSQLIYVKTIRERY